MEYTNSITVIDFETATNANDSICAVGLVVLKDGGIVLDERLQGVIPRKYGECTELCERVLACLEK